MKHALSFVLIVFLTVACQAQRQSSEAAVEQQCIYHIQKFEFFGGTFDEDETNLMVAHIESLDGTVLSTSNGEIHAQMRCGLTLEELEGVDVPMLASSRELP